MMTSPCLDCPDRHPNCHAECGKYEEYRNTLEEIKAKQIEIKRANSYVTKTKTTIKEKMRRKLI